MVSCMCELLWLYYLLHDLLVLPTKKSTLICDNLAVIHIASNPVLHERTKHIEIVSLGERSSTSLLISSPNRLASNLCNISYLNWKCLIFITFSLYILSLSDPSSQSPSLGNSKFVSMFVNSKFYLNKHWNSSSPNCATVVIKPPCFSSFLINESINLHLLSFFPYAFHSSFQITSSWTSTASVTFTSEI